MMNIKAFNHRFISSISLILAFSVGVLAQMPPVRAPRPAQPLPQEDFTWWYITLFVLVLGLGGAVYWWYKNKQAGAENDEEDLEELEEFEENSFDADKELEWFRKNSKNPEREKRKLKKKAQAIAAAKNAKKAKRAKKAQAEPKKSKISLHEEQEKRQKLEQIKFEKLPIHSIVETDPPVRYEPLPVSDDEGLLSAIEQSHDEYEEDVEVRELALRVLAKFKTGNSIESLSQIALYDLSANLRSSAVSALADFDHESVFETILLACADPTREVRAAAARSLFRLSFDRAEAWTRIAECGDEFRTVRGAKAAIESDLVERSIDRLVHEDRKYAYEAFALVALLVKAGETKEIFEVIESQSNKSVKLAIFHCLKVLKDPETLPDLYTYIERNSLPEDLSNAANEVIRSFDLVPA